jgi:hypothetical protein
MLKKLLIICVALTALLTGAWVKSLSYNEATDFKILGGQELSWKNLEGNWVVVRTLFTRNTRVKSVLSSQTS